jgi:hypothetical protein
VFLGQSVPGTGRVYMFEIACGRSLGLGKKNFAKDVTEVPREIRERITDGYVFEKALFRERWCSSHGVFIL